MKTKEQELQQEIEDLQEEIRGLEETVSDLRSEIEGFDDYVDPEDFDPTEYLSTEELSQLFRTSVGIESSMVNDQKFDLFVKHIDKVSLEDLEQFFQSKGLEIV